MIRAFIGAIAMLLLAGAGAGAGASSEGSESAPGIFALPQLGSAGFVCGRDWQAGPFFDLGSAIATEAVTIGAGPHTRRNFSYEVVGRHHGRPVLEQEVSRARELVLPFGDYRSVSFTIRQDTEPREIVAGVRAELVTGTVAVRGVGQRRGACYVKRWSVRMDVRPN